MRVDLHSLISPPHLAEARQRVAEIREHARAFGGGGRRRAQTAPSASFHQTLAQTCLSGSPSEDISRAIAQAAARYGLSPSLIRAVAACESGLQPGAVSADGAMGLMQLMPATARALGVADPFDIFENVDAGARYLRSQLDRFGGDLVLALAAYNAGPAAVRRYRGVPPYQETQRFVARVLAALRHHPEP